MSFPVPCTELTFAPVLRVEFCVCVEVGGGGGEGGFLNSSQVNIL